MKTGKPKLSAGVLVYRIRDGVVDVLIAHPGGPFWARKDDGVWSIPKGEYADGDDPWAAAQREFREELGLPVPAGPRIDFGPHKQPSGKVVTAFAVAVSLSAFYPELAAGLFFCAVSVAASRILLGMHFLSDVVAGAAIGTLLALASTWTVRLL